MKGLFIGLALFSIIAMPASAAMLYFVPQDSNATYGSTTDVMVMVNAPNGINAAQFAINYSSSCAKITDVAFNPVWPLTSWNNTLESDCWGTGHDWITTAAFADYTGDVWICNITILGNSTSYCKTDLNFVCGLDYGKCGILLYNTSGSVSGTPLPLVTNDGTFTCGTPSPETFSKLLHEGWNLISLPLTPDDNSTSEVLNGVSYNAVMSYDATSKQFEDASTMDPGTGYFVYVETASTWMYDGYAYTSMGVSLEQGLNMVGWLNCSMDVDDALASVDYNYVARWNANEQRYEVYNPRAPDGFNDFTMLDRGEGYFISAKGEYTLAKSCS